MTNQPPAYGSQPAASTPDARATTTRRIMGIQSVLFVVGAVCSVLVSVHRYLTRPRTGGEPADPASTRVVS